METSNISRPQLIMSLMASTEKGVGAAINVWEQLATQITSIIGEDGFNSLYARSIFLTQSTFPWLAAIPLPPQTDTDHRFAELKISFERQTPAQVSEASGLLLITFTDILALLIGEQLTAHILHLAWGADISNRTGKEFENE